MNHCDIFDKAAIRESLIGVEHRNLHAQGPERGNIGRMLRHRQLDVWLASLLRRQPIPQRARRAADERVSITRRNVACSRVPGG